MDQEEQPQATEQQMQMLSDYVGGMESPLPYHEAHAEVTAAMSVLDNPPNFTDEQISGVLGDHGMGPAD